jgi:phosphoribosylcarboxyaminoimidazole (NCAIR) mutase
LAGFAWAAFADSPITIAFPRPGARLPGITNVYCIGAVPTGVVQTLTINGATTDVYRTGAFLAMVPVAMVDGLQGVVYRQFSLVLAAAALASALAAVVVVPATTE